MDGINQPLAVSQDLKTQGAGLTSDNPPSRKRLGIDRFAFYSLCLRMAKSSPSRPPTAAITGASRGVGRGVATALVEAGYRVFATGRTINSADLPGAAVSITCDHINDDETADAFARVLQSSEGLDVLVNSVWGGYERMVEDGQFTWHLPFWEQPRHRLCSMMDARR